MAPNEGPRSNSTVQQTVTISTGQTVDVPVSLQATMLGAVFAAPKRQVSEMLPAGLQPIRATPTGDAAVTFLSVEYHDVGIPDVEPYNEFAVIIPASHVSPSTVPYVSALTQATNGYVWYMPVTTDPSRAFGVDIWGFPKVVADITHTDDGSVRETTVSVDGEHFITLAVDRPPRIEAKDDGVSYTVKDDQLLRVPNKIDAEIGFWPFSTDVSVSFGDHRKADQLRALELGSRALGRISLDGEVSFYQGEPV